MEILIDLDNTIVDSNEAHMAAFNLALKKFKINCKIDYSRIKGLSTREALTSLGVDLDLLSEVASLKSDLYLSYIKSGKVTLFPDSFLSLKELAEAKHDVSICTAASAASIDALSQKKIIRFESRKIFTTLRIGHSKLNEQYWYKVLKVINANVRSVVVIDDSVDVLSTCKSSGINNLIHVRCKNQCSSNFLCVTDLLSAIKLFEKKCWF
jgi:beta-phosphoglucomutase-like phosphatase (HAD superfamily)